MAFSPISLLLRRPTVSAALQNPLLSLLYAVKVRPFPISLDSGCLARSFSAAPLPQPDPSDSPIPSLSARLSFVFDQIDAIERDRSAKDEALQRIRSWRQSKPQPQPPPPAPAPSYTHDDADSRPVSEAIGPRPLEVRTDAPDARTEESIRDVFRKEVELVHPWPEWIELMERLSQQNYFDFRRTDEERIAANVGIDLSGIKDETGFDFYRDWTTVRNACMNFGRDRFDILRSLSRKDLQILVGHGCPSMDSKVVFSAKLLRKLVHLDEGDVCSSCSLRSSCSRGFILTHKEDEARTIDVMRILLTYGFDHVNESVENKPLKKMKSVRIVVRKLLHEIVKLSAVPIDPNLPPPVIKKPPPKVKIPPPLPKKRVGRDDVEMKKGDWLCTKCDFMNFAKNTVCLQCDAKRPKRQLLPGEWECPQCNFLNYRRNMACFHCDAKRPPDEYTDNQMQEKQSGSRTRMQRTTKMQDVSNAWNFDFDDNESDGADVAAYEFADSRKIGEDAVLDPKSRGGVERVFEDDSVHNGRMPRFQEGDKYFKEADARKSTLHSHRTGFDDFDDEEDDVDSYELDDSGRNQMSKVSRRNYSELEETSESEDFDKSDCHVTMNRSATDHLSGSDGEGHVEHPYWRSSNAGRSRQKAESRGGLNSVMKISSGSDYDDEVGSDIDDDMDNEFRSKKRIGRQKNPRSERRGSISDFDEGFLGSDYDDKESCNNRSSRGNRFASRESTRQLRHTDGLSGRRASLVGGYDGLPSRSSRVHGKGPQKDGYGRPRKTNELRRFDSSGAENGSDFRDRAGSRGSLRHSSGAENGSGFRHRAGSRGSLRHSSGGENGSDFRRHAESKGSLRHSSGAENGSDFRHRAGSRGSLRHSSGAENGSGFRRHAESRGSLRHSSGAENGSGFRHHAGSRGSPRR